MLLAEHAKAEAKPVATATLFSSFPKERPPLPPEFAAIYLKHYRNSREGKSKLLSLVKNAESWMHRKVAEDVKSGVQKSTLELGAGTLNQLPYEPQSEPYDIVEPFRELCKASPHLQRVRNIYDDILEVPHTARYERITSVAVLEHICNLPEVIAQSGLLLAEGGQFRAGIPSEGTILWRLGWKATTALEFRLRYRLDYEVLMRHEHVNSAREIEDVLRYFFSEVEESDFGLTKSVSFYQFYACAKPRVDECLRYVKKVSPQSSNLRANPGLEEDRPAAQSDSVRSA
jgi:hypothetical protein